MSHDTVKFARYWRNSLKDAVFLQGFFPVVRNRRTKQYEENPLLEKFFQDTAANFNRGTISATLFNKTFKTKEQKVLNVTLRPYVYKLRSECSNLKLPQTLIPIYFKAYISRDGRIYPQKHTLNIARDLLNPFVDPSMSFGDSDHYQNYLNTQKACSIDYEGKKASSYDDYLVQWQEYLAALEAFHRTILKNSPQDLNLKQNYLLCDYFLLGINTDSDNKGQGPKYILDLYDDILQSRLKLPLFSSYCAVEPHDLRPAVTAASTLDLRLAHSNRKYALNPAQRDALAHFLQLQNGEILAVNGPPGTGKTSLVLDIIASMWTYSAVNKEEYPPIIAAASTNNQAVTNIIDAFAGNFESDNEGFNHRWVPELNTFGAYYPAFSKLQENNNKYLTYEHFTTKIETFNFYQKAKTHFLNEASTAFKHDITSVSEALELIHGIIINKISTVHNLLSVHDKVNSLLQQNGFRSEQELSDKILELRTRCNKLNDEYHHWNMLNTKWLNFLSEHSGLLHGALTVIPSYKRNATLKALLYFKQLWDFDDPLPEVADEKNITALLQGQVQKCKEKLQNCTQELHQAEELLSTFEDNQTEWQLFCSEFNLSDTALSAAELDAELDTKARFYIFWLAVHYWEARWLMVMNQQHKEITAANKARTILSAPELRRRWQLRSMLTPCIVSTFYILPNHLRCNGKSTGNNGRYLYNFLDLLIVDEAGQVLPEVAGASFALAKKALVFGDVFQLEPIWNISEEIDRNNLLSAGLIKDDTADADFKRLKDTGKTVSSGSAMLIAQQTSPYHYNRDLSRGMFLYEHRRCYDDIIKFCNTLVYQDKLQPKRGKAPDDTLCLL